MDWCEVIQFLWLNGDLKRQLEEKTSRDGTKSIPRPQMANHLYLRCDAYFATSRQYPKKKAPSWMLGALAIAKGAFS